jgi:hypothetical protein
MRARNIAMPNSRLPSKYSTDISEYIVAKAPRFISVGEELAICKTLVTNFGDSVVNSGRIKGSAKE